MTHPVEADLVAVVQGHILNQPRSLQTAIGPSELGIPCDRRIGYKLAGVPAVNDRGVPWRPFVGTALHSEFAMVFELDAYEGKPNAGRWLIEEKVTAGPVNGTDVEGLTDLFDTWTGTVVDWKFTTRNKLREYRAHGPGQQYGTQAHAYGRGWAAKGYKVTEVAVFFWTRDGDFTDRLWWSESYREDVALDALDRVTGIAQILDALTPAMALPLLPIDGATYCTYCPAHRPGSTNLATACPGDPATVKAAPTTLADALGN